MNVLICLSGMPGVGKTTWAKGFMKAHPDFLYFSPDEYYQRINGDDTDRSNTFEVWQAMFRDIHIAELDKKNVLIDSDNLTYAQRMQWIDWFPSFDKKELILFYGDFDTCLQRVSKRRRTIPLQTMKEKWNKKQGPMLDESKKWDFIIEIKEIDE